MKRTVFFIFCALFLQACSEDKTNTPVTLTTNPNTQSSHQKAQTVTNKPSQWNGSTLSTATIKKVQEAQYNYRQCVHTEAQKQGYQKIDTRVATDAVIKQCETSLAQVRSVLVNDGVPPIIADRFLKKTRVVNTRNILKSLMFAEAARNAGATQ